MNRVKSFDDCVEVLVTVACNDGDLRGPCIRDCDLSSLVCQKDHRDSEWKRL